jgi:hypothetical protein
MLTQLVCTTACIDIAEIVVLLQPFSAFRGDTIYHMGSQADEVFFVVRVFTGGCLTCTQPRALVESASLRVPDVPHRMKDR